MPRLKVLVASDRSKNSAMRSAPISSPITPGLHELLHFEVGSTCTALTSGRFNRLAPVQG